VKHDRWSNGFKNLRMLKKAVQQGRSSEADPRFTFHASRFTVFGGDARTPLADFFSILLSVCGRKNRLNPVMVMTDYPTLRRRDML
jgi:hypothetical protein